MRKACFLLMISGLCLASPSYSQESAKLFNFFDGLDIDYWNEGRTTKLHFAFGRDKDGSRDKPELFQGSNILRHGDSKKFRWEKYQDPNTPEFWDDGGDWIPPRPFREAAANPTPENIQNYLSWLAEKGMVVSRFQENLAKAALSPAKKTTVPWQDVEILYFYQSSCPHCRASVPTVEKLKSLGAKLHAVQLDFGAEPSLHRGSEPYSESMRSRFQVSVTPTWILKIGKKISELTGNLSFSELEHVVLETKNKRDSL